MNRLINQVVTSASSGEGSLKYSSATPIHEAFRIARVPDHWAGRENKLREAIARLYAPRETSELPMTELGANLRARR